MQHKQLHLELRADLYDAPVVLAKKVRPYPVLSRLPMSADDEIGLAARVMAEHTERYEPLLAADDPDLQDAIERISDMWEDYLDRRHTGAAEKAGGHGRGRPAQTITTSRDRTAAETAC